MIRKEREIHEAVELCLDNGRLNPQSVGWARKPIITANMKGNFLRKKKWNYWCVYSHELLFSATISHLDYAAVCFVYYIHYESRAFGEKTIIVPFDRKTKMPEKVQETLEFSHRQMHLSFLSNQKESWLKVSVDQIAGHYLEADLHIQYPENLDSLNVVVAWNERQFQFTAKHHCLPSSGYVRIGDETYQFHPESDFAVLDYGRGIWPRHSQWNWGMASQKQGEDVIGLNIGGKWTDATPSTENAIIINGHLHKISEDLAFHFDPKRRMEPWQVRSSSGKVDLSFQPFFERVAKSNIGIVRSEVHQLLGHYKGVIQLEDGHKVEIDQLLGCIEDHEASW